MSRAFSGSVRACVCMCIMCVCVCQHSETKTTGHIITRIGRWILHDKSWSSISFEVKRLNVKVTGSISVPFFTHAMHFQWEGLKEKCMVSAYRVIHFLCSQKVTCQGWREFATLLSANSPISYALFIHNHYSDGHTVFILQMLSYLQQQLQHCYKPCCC